MGATRFCATHVVRAPVERVLAFYRAPDVLRRLTPPSVAVHVVSAEPLGENSVLEFDLGLPLVPRKVVAVRWRARHSGFESAHDAHGALVRHAFTDVMEAGPLAAWRHRHEFSRAELGGTRVRDVIDYAHHAGPRSWPARLAFNNASLSLLFAWRALVSRVLLGGRASA
ncbi:hypothetical protein KFE25_013153 [Diacronema lutheri]|uniref:Coenzyme Q-binding protein COQ10 START domain-containing protein n=2 Tax=Diacronema lutheri TaxID=2081491 RepID=A0A8J5X6L1_DIALT|nr:hypothetical protein KFE25_013153 [Diacronema lutheri]